MEIKILIDVIGWIGTGLLLMAFFLVSTKRTQGDTGLYQGLNILGSGLLIANSFYYGAFPSVGINIAWIAIATFSLARRIAGAT
jgi:hypothetical protein